VEYKHYPTATLQKWDTTGTAEQKHQSKLRLTGRTTTDNTTTVSEINVQH
jgi:hypothetical protein